MSPATKLKQHVFRLTCAMDTVERKAERCNLRELEEALQRVEGIAYQARMAARECQTLAAMDIEEVRRGH